jgi:hypothetical protein
MLSGGCREKSASPTQQSQQEQLRQSDRGEAVLKAAISQLHDLPAAVDTELRPPVVLLDSRKSADGQDVLAQCTSDPKISAGVFNVIQVTTGNGRFRGLGVKAGDTLKYYVLEDTTVDEDSRSIGFSKKLAMDLKVAQVLDDNTLILESGLNQAVPAAKIEIWRNVDDRLSEINEKLRFYEVNRWPPIAWEPAPDGHVLTQVLTWLNQWIRQSDPKVDWKREPLLDKLDASVADNNKEMAAQFKLEGLTARVFDAVDPRHIQEAIWLRDISRWAHGEGYDDVSRATALFDWTIRNIQLEPDDRRLPRRPWQTLLYGRGTADQRAWVFALLCRQQGLDVVLLGMPSAPAADGKAGENSTAKKFWLPALFSEGNLYVFDTRLGLPIPGPNGKGVATLEQLRKDDALFRQLDVEGAKYPLTADSLKNVEIDLVADPFSLSRRAAQLEVNLSGDDRLVLSTKPSALAERLKSVPGVNAIRLWSLPFATIRDQLTLGKASRHDEAVDFEPFAMRPGLWKGRTRHFQGRHQEALGDAFLQKGMKKTVDGYLSKSVRPTEKEISESGSEDRRRVDTTSKNNAAYWVGLMSFDDGKFTVAETWLKRPELLAAGSLWAFGANYNLARALEAQAKYAEAIAILEKDVSPQQHGNKLRARMLKAKSKEKTADKLRD